jgi:hypothetical protein
MTQTAIIAPPHSMYDPNNLLNTVKQHLNLDSDSALSQKLKVATDIIKNIRDGRLPVYGSMLLWMQEATGIGVDELRRLMGDRRAKHRLHYCIVSNAQPEIAAGIPRTA